MPDRVNNRVVRHAATPAVEALETRQLLSSIDVANNTLISLETTAGTSYEITAGDANDDITVTYVAATGDAGAHYDIRQSARSVLVRLTAPALTGFRVIGGNGNDTIIIVNQPGDPLLSNTIYGGNGGDAIFTGPGNDRIFAGAGKDVVNSGDGKDTVYGEAGDDSLRGAGSSDLLDGGDGYDTVRGDAGNDNLSGGANPDRLRGSAGNDTLDGGGGRDLLAGEAGDDSLYGGTADDVVDGGIGLDTLRGGPGQDQIAVSNNDHDDYDASEIAANEGIDQDAMRAGSGYLTVGGTIPYSGNVVITPTGSISGGAIIANGGAATVGATSTINLSGGKLDLSNNKLITTATDGASNTAIYDGVTGLVTTGRNGGGWGGTGIVIGATPYPTGDLTSLGVATAEQVNGVGTTDTVLWSGKTITGSDTLVMYTYGGDANLDGKITVDDYARIDANTSTGANGWYNGDFNYDGRINVDDYSVIDFNLAIQESTNP
jgi:hypothetical protein